MMAMASGAVRVKKCALLCAAVSAVLFLMLSFVPGSRQDQIFPAAEICDYRMFVLPTLESAKPYNPDAIHPRDACYPPIVYGAVKIFSSDKGTGWSMTGGERRLLSSLFLLQCLGVFLLVSRLPSVGVRVVAAVVAVLSPACICSVLRGNPSGWAFAFVCVFLFWYDADSKWKRMMAALSLGAATALKISPCVFGVLYLSGRLRTYRAIPFGEILVAAFFSVILIFLPFAWHGGMSAVVQWLSNAAANAEFYSQDNPIWGFVCLANNLIDSDGQFVPGAAWYALATRILAFALVVGSLFVRGKYLRLLFIGAAMAFLTHHDYGGAYLLPAFVAWLQEHDAQGPGVCLLLEAIGWFFILTPLQFPNPFAASWSMNVMLQCEFLFVLLMCGFAGRPCTSPCAMRKEGERSESLS